ncbi:MAG TPA: caspase family protein [Actinoplanes sp.]|nr:caspase family protein [Actinoplanes sp.]
MDDIPAVERDVRELAALLTDPDLWGLPGENCRTVVDPTSGEQVLRAVYEAASAATEALVVYFAGHGLLDDSGELYLALPEATREQLWGAVRFADVRREVITTAQGCRAKVVLLDCCFSGRAMSGFMSGPGQLADHAVVDGAYLMTATAENMPAIAAPGAEYTAFTGAFLETLRDGVPGGPPLLAMGLLFTEVDRRLRARNFPRPQQRSRNDGHRIVLARNRATDSPPAEPPDQGRTGSRRRAPMRAASFAAVLLLLAIIGWQVDLFRNVPETTGPSLTPSSGARSTAAAAETTGTPAPKTRASPAPEPGGPPVTISASEESGSEEPIGGSTPDGSIRVRFTGWSTGRQELTFFVVTPDRSCTVDKGRVGQSVVIPEQAGGWIRIVIDDVRSSISKDSADGVVVHIALLVSRVIGDSPKSDVACN